MKNPLLLAFVFCASFSFAVSAQSVAGKWYGVGMVKKAGSYNSYLSELILKVKGNKVTGEYNYYFKDAEIKRKVTGTYDSRYRLLELNASPVINFLAKDANGAECPMEGSFTMRVSRLESSLTGQFNPTFSYRFTCPAINIKFVRQKAEPPVTPFEDLEEDTTEAPLPVTAVKKDPVLEALNQRIFETPEVIEVDADSLKVTLYDNGEVDHDTISVFYNRKLVAYKQMLSDKPMTFVLPLDTSINEMAMYAENLGTIAPNTALAVIYAGEKRFELSMTSTFIKNAVIRFRRKQKDAKNVN